MAVLEFKLTTNQLSTDVDLGMSVTSVADPNRVIITSPSGYLVASGVTYNQLLALVDSTDEFASIHNQDDVIQDARFSISDSAHVGGYGLIETFVSPQITGHQGYATDGTYHYIFDTARIDKRNNDGTWSIALSNTSPFTGILGTANHLGDGDYYSGVLYVPVENFGGCAATFDQKICTYNATTLALINQFDISAQAHEVSSVAIDGVNNVAYVSSFCDGSKLWKYNATTFTFIGVVTLPKTLSQIQGVSYYNGFVYINSEQEGIFKYEISSGELTILSGRKFSNRVSEGIAVVGGQIRSLIDHIGDGTNCNVYFLDESTTSLAGFYTNKSGESVFTGNLEVGNKLSVTTTSSIGSVNIGVPEIVPAIYMESIGSVGAIGHDDVNTFISKNGYYRDEWIRPSASKSSLGLFLNDINNRFEFRASPPASGLTWTIPAYLNTRGDLNLDADFTATANNQTISALNITPSFTAGVYTGLTSNILRAAWNGSNFSINDAFSSQFVGFYAVATPTTTNYFLRGHTSSVQLNSPTGSGTIDLRVINDTKMRMYGATGNVTFQNGGAFTDDTVNRVQVTGSIKATQYNVTAMATAPASATATGTLGEVRITATHIYVCTATNTWVRSALTTW